MHVFNVQHDTNTCTEIEIPDKEVREIVNEILSGKVELFDKIFVSFHHRVYALAWNMTGNYDDAMDVVQECFIRTYRALKSWKGRAKFTTWLHRIAINTSIDFIRREAKHKSSRIESGGNEDICEMIQRLSEGVDNRTPFSELERKELRQRIFRAINQLSGRQKKCFILRYFSGKTIKEIALITNCGEGTTKRHLFRARMKLQNLLEAD
jgi:RNA polymerase sigma-70 factor, ECF subfamily